MQLSKIGWCDYSGGDLNFARGCTPVSEGCQHCYAKELAHRFARPFEATWDHAKLERLTSKQWPSYSPKRGAPYSPMVFVVDTGDLFHENYGDMVILGALRRMILRRAVTWIVLTKRAERMHEVVSKLAAQRPDGLLPPHIWLGVTAENYVRMHQRLPILRDTPASTRFVSMEPMLGPMGPLNLDGLNWVIVGAESGPKRRPFDVAWAADVKRQCDETGVPFFGKQASGLRPGAPLLFDGQECKAWPAR